MSDSPAPGSLVRLTSTYSEANVPTIYIWQDTESAEELGRADEGEAVLLLATLTVERTGDESLKSTVHHLMLFSREEPLLGWVDSDNIEMVKLW